MSQKKKTDDVTHADQANPSEPNVEHTPPVPQLPPLGTGPGPKRDALIGEPAPLGGPPAAQPPATRNPNNMVDPPPNRRWTCRLAQSSPATVEVEAPTEEEARAAYLRAIKTLHTTERIICTPTDEPEEPPPAE